MLKCILGLVMLTIAGMSQELYAQDFIGLRSQEAPQEETQPFDGDCAEVLHQCRGSSGCYSFQDIDSEAFNNCVLMVDGKGRDPKTHNQVHEKACIESCERLANVGRCTVSSCR
jgi:hypothetical protein